MSSLIRSPERLKSLVSTRLFEPSDLRAIYAIEEACFEAPQRFSLRLMKSLIQDTRCTIWVGTVDHLLAGFAIARMRAEEAPDSAYIWTIEVLPAFRRVGFAQQLLLRIEESARLGACTAIELHVSASNLAAISLYEKCGYTRGVDVYGFYGPGEDGIEYRKTISGR